MSNEIMNITNIINSIEHNDLKQLKKQLHEVNASIYKEHMFNICDTAVVSNPGDYDILEYLFYIGAFNILSKSQRKIILRSTGESSLVIKNTNNSFNYFKSGAENFKIQMIELQEKYKKLKTEHDKVNDTCNYLLKNSISVPGHITMIKELEYQENEINRLLKESSINENIIKDLTTKVVDLTEQNKILVEKNKNLVTVNDKLVEDNQTLKKNAQESDEAFTTLLKEKKRKRGIK